VTIDPEARAYLEATAALGLPPIWEQGAEDARRAVIERYPELAGPLEPVERVENRFIPGPAGPLAVRAYTPLGAGADPLPAVVYFHGGGWVTGNLDTHDCACHGTANRAGCLVVAVDYRCAPEHRFPAAVEDAWAAVQWLAEHGSEIGADPARLAVCGDSAGGNLAAVVALRARDRGGPRLAAQLLLYPVIDHNLETTSYRANATGYGLTREAMRWYWQQYLGEAGDGQVPEASPLRAADHSGLAPALVVVCQLDPLLDEGLAYAAKLEAAGVPVELVVEKGMIHGHFRMPAVMSRARKSWDDCGRFLRRQFDRDRS
jgi:acetyl esterase